MSQPLHLDFETRSELDLKKVGLWNYARHPSTDVWCAAWAFDDDEPRLWMRAGMPFPDEDTAPMLDFVRAGGRLIAHNAAFELAIWNEIMAKRYGWPALKPEQTECTMVGCYAMGLPGALENAAMALGLTARKDLAGRALMLRMARPRSKAGVTPVVWWDEADKLAQLYAYCQQDVRVEREIHKRVLPLSETERRVWLLDYKINQRGVAIDRQSAEAAVVLADTMGTHYAAVLNTLTSGRVKSVNALIPMKDWLTERGVSADALAKQDVVDLLERDDLSEECRKVLTIRQDAGKASNAKFDKMLALAGDDDRLRNMYQYHGAATGRWGGRGVQTHNLPRVMPKAEQVEKILAHVRRGDHRAIDMIYGPPLAVVSSCLRSFFVAPEGKTLLNGDFANVEGRGQAWFAGEQWKLRAFEAADAGTGPGLYELAYSRMFGVPVESVKNPSEERQIGKVSELAFGYAGGVGSFRTMGKVYGVKVPDATADEFKHAWRAAHPAIRRCWYDIQNAAIAAVRSPGEPFVCGFPGRQATFKKVGSFLWCRLPSARVICYTYPKILEGDYEPELTYMTVPSPDDAKKMKIIYDSMNSASWARVGTYGGSLFNNIVQGFCRDFLAHVLLELDVLGAAVVMHTHDDVLLEVLVERAEGARTKMQEIMRTLPAWAVGFPLYTKVESMRRFGK